LVALLDCALEVAVVVEVVADRAGMAGAGLRWNGVFLADEDTEAKGFEVEEKEDEEEDEVELMLVGAKLEDLPTKPIPEPLMELLLLLELGLLFLLDLK